MRRSEVQGQHGFHIQGQHGQVSKTCLKYQRASKIAQCKTLARKCKTQSLVPSHIPLTHKILNNVISYRMIMYKINCMYYIFTVEYLIMEKSN